MEAVVKSKGIKNSWKVVNDISTPEALTQELVTKIDALLSNEDSVVEIPTEVCANNIFSLIFLLIYSLL